ncbi:MAG: YMGG-like glycine zipper-containing protein [Opitutus sp.]
MKSSLTACLLAVLAVTASLSAQGLRPEAVNGAVIGGVAGAIIGNNSGDFRHNGLRGAAYGAGAGMLIGQMAGDSRGYGSRTQVRVHAAPRTYLYRDSGRYYGHGGYYGYRGDRPWRGGYYYRPGYTYTDSDYYGYSDYDSSYYGGSSYATNGLLLGGLAGAIIGYNSGGLHHNAWRGAGIGAAAGYLFGSIAENNARRREAILTQQAGNSGGAGEQPTSAAPAVVDTPAPVTAAKLQSSTPMSSANSLFGR